MNWKNNFSRQILNRGRKYYEEGAVLNAERHKDGSVTALVEGEDDYLVTIKFERKEPAFISCTCPYAKSGNFCKHMAAVLFFLEEEEPVQIEPSGQNINALIDSMSKEDMKKILKKFAESSPELQAMIRAETEDPFGKHAMTAALKKMEQIVRRFKMPNGSLYPYRLVPFCEALGSFLQETIPACLEAVHPVEAMHILNQAYIDILIVNSYDFSGTVERLCTDIFEYWCEASELLNQDEMKTLRNEMQRIGYRYAVHNNIEFLTSFLEVEMHTEEELREELQSINRHLSITEGPYAPPVYNSMSGDTSVIHRCLRLMNRLHYSDDQIHDWLIMNKRFVEVQEKMLEMAMNRKDWDTAEQILLECREDERQSEARMDIWYSKLTDLYLMTHQDGKLKSFMIKEAVTSSAGMICFKNNCQRLGTEIRKDILSAIVCSGTADEALCEILADDGMYLELEEVILRLKSVFLLQAYLKVLCDHNLDTALDLYVDSLNTAAATARNRAQYDFLTDGLNTLWRIEKGKEEAEKLLTEWTIRYHNRRVFMEELEYWKEYRVKAEDDFEISELPF